MNERMDIGPFSSGNRIKFNEKNNWLCYDGEACPRFELSFDSRNVKLTSTTRSALYTITSASHPIQLPILTDKDEPKLVLVWWTDG
jgi:hypothetical protein